MRLHRDLVLLSRAALLAVLLGAPSPAPAAQAAPLVRGSVMAVASASVTVLAPQAISAAQTLTFGAVTRGKTSVAGAGLIATRSGASGVFQISGPPNTIYALSQSLRFDRPGLRDAAVVAEAPRAGAAGLLPASGAQEIRYSGAFSIEPAAASGLYTGALAVTANYN